MIPDPYEKEIKALKLLDDRSHAIESVHQGLGDDISIMKERLKALGAESPVDEAAYALRKAEHLAEMSKLRPLKAVPLPAIYAEAAARYPERVSLDQVLSVDHWARLDTRLEDRIDKFNVRYELDRWDYAIAGACGLLAAMLDLLCVKAPPKPTVPWQTRVDGVFNQQVQKAFNSLLTPDLSKELCKKYPIGAPDSSVFTDLSGAPAKALNPFNHRLRSLAHDPILGFLFGLWDMKNGTCTIVKDGVLKSFPSTKGPMDGSIFQMLGRMFGHLLSDVNAPTSGGNRGMGLPAPFMGLSRMLGGIPLGDSNFGKQVEWMYVNGYDFRQFVVTSIPMAIMEVMLRVFYAVKQVCLYKASFADSILDTIPLRMNPRFRIILALAYGTSSAVNAGKMYITGSILNANYASWLGLAWNGFHALKWALLDKHLNLWGGIEASEIAELESLVTQIDDMTIRAAALPT